MPVPGKSHTRTPRAGRRIAAVLSATALAAGGALAAAAPAGADGHGAQHGATPTVNVHGANGRVSVDRSSVSSGVVRFRVSGSDAQGSDVSMFKPKHGSSVARVLADLREEFSPTPAVDAKGTRDLVRDAVIAGLAQVVPQVGATVTEQLRPGTYYLFDANAAGSGQAPKLTPLQVTDRRHHSTAEFPGDHPTVTMTTSDRFVTPHVLPAHGTVTMRNASDTIHFASFLPVKRGTTDAQVQAYFASGVQTPPPFVRPGPSIGMDVQSPGREANFSYRLPPGTYVLVCFVSDDKTGMPHALMGMHKVVVLK